MLSCFGVHFSEIAFNGALSVVLVDSGMGWLGVAGHPWPPVANYRLVQACALALFGEERYNVFPLLMIEYRHVYAEPLVVICTSLFTGRLYIFDCSTFV